MGGQLGSCLRTQQEEVVEVEFVRISAGASGVLCMRSFLVVLTAVQKPQNGGSWIRGSG